jgi:hypothetical protein
MRTGSCLAASCALKQSHYTGLRTQLGGVIMDFEEILGLLGGLFRAFGSLVFGVSIGWLVLKILKEHGKVWQLVMAAVLGLLGAFLVLAGWGPSSTTVGAFGLGAGAAILGWGLWTPPKPKPKKKE